jgi:hypothetical protein
MCDKANEGGCSGQVEYCFDDADEDGSTLKYVYLCEAHRGDAEIADA